MRLQRTHVQHACAGCPGWWAVRWVGLPVTAPHTGGRCDLPLLAVRALARSNLHGSRTPGHALHSPARPYFRAGGGFQAEQASAVSGLVSEAVLGGWLGVRIGTLVEVANYTKGEVGRLLVSAAAAVNEGSSG